MFRPPKGAKWFLTWTRENIKLRCWSVDQLGSIVGITLLDCPFNVHTISILYITCINNKKFLLLISCLKFKTITINKSSPGSRTPSPPASSAEKEEIYRKDLEDRPDEKIRNRFFLLLPKKCLNILKERGKSLR